MVLCFYMTLWIEKKVNDFFVFFLFVFRELLCSSSKCCSWILLVVRISPIFSSISLIRSHLLRSSTRRWLKNRLELQMDADVWKGCEWVKTWVWTSTNTKYNKYIRCLLLISFFLLRFKRNKHVFVKFLEVSKDN